MLEKYILKNEKTASRIIDGQAVVMTLEDNTLHTLNEVGTKIWELCDGQNTVEEIVRGICEEYEVGQLDGKSDCLFFIEELSAKGMISLLDAKVEK